MLVPRDGDLRKRCLQTFSQLDRIVVGPEMDKKETGLFVEHVAVNGRHLNAVVMQGADQRIHFVGDYDEVTGDRGLPISCGLEVDSDGGTHGWWNWHAILGDLPPRGTEN